MKLILQGPTGSGKTTLAHTILNDTGWRYANTSQDVKLLDSLNIALLLDNVILHPSLLRTMEKATTHVIATTIHDVPETTIPIFHLTRSSR